MNGSCQCCTCRCCGFCILICWIIFGAIGAASYLTADISTSNSDITDYTNCPRNTGDVTGECCVIVDVVYPSTCGNLQTAVTLTGVNDLLAAIAGIVGLVGLAQMMAMLLLAPIGYSVLSVLLGIVAM